VHLHTDSSHFALDDERAAHAKIVDHASCAANKENRKDVTGVHRNPNISADFIIDDPFDQWDDSVSYTCDHEIGK